MKTHLKRSCIWIAFIFFSALLWMPNAPAYAQPIRVVTTTQDLADITRQIGKDLVSVESLAQGPENIHAVPIRPSFVPRLNRAAVLVVMGLDYEIAWLPALLEVASNPRILPGRQGYIDCSAGVPVVEAPRILDRSEGDVHPKGNPHFHLDPVYGKIIARNIAEGLSRQLPQHQQLFQKNLKSYLAELDRWIARWQEMATSLKGLKFVEYHLEWSYFANRFGLQRVGTIELKPGIEPTPSHLVNLVERVQQEKVPFIIFTTQSDRLPRQVASQTGAKALRLPTMTRGNSEADTYIKMIDYNVRTLVSAVKGG
jgi:zinc/manganese transport system substrate-binding protein